MSAPRVLDLSSGVRSAETPKDLSRWHGKKEVLYDLYIRQRKTLEDVKSIMETEHGFPKTLKHSDYEHVLREEFKYRKNLSADDWRLSVGPHIARRKALGKLSEVTLNGFKVPNVDRRIRRSLQSKRSHRRANANDAALPHAVVIRTPSPQPSTLVASPTFRGNRTTNEIEGHQQYQSTRDCLADSSFAADSELLSLLTGVMPPSGAGSGATVMSAQLLREGCPINKLLAILDEYQRRFSPTDLRLFGPNATIGVLGRICFDFSNGLYGKTISRHEMTSILDWIGFSVDVASLKVFFAQNALTILAVWEALNSIVRKRRHSAAFDVLLSVYLSITDQAPWTKPTGRRIFDFPSIMELAPTRAVTLLNASLYDQRELDAALGCAARYRSMTEVVKQLVSAGASLKNSYCRTSVDSLICDFGSRECEANDLTLLKLLLEAGAVVDELLNNVSDRLGWVGPGGPYLATDYLLLSEHFTRNHGLWTLVSQYSDRQQTTMTVPGIFEAAQRGQDQLHFYLNSHLKPSSDQDRQQVLELAFSEASGWGYVNVVQSLMQFGVDPNVRMLQPVNHFGSALGTGPHGEYQTVWHPVIRALNTGELETVLVLLAVSSIDIALLDERLGKQLDLCALRHMADSQRHQILQVLSTLDLSEVSRTKIFYVRSNLILGQGTTGRRAAGRCAAMAIQTLVRAVERHCDIRALNYLIERDVRVLSALSATDIGALLDATLESADEYKCQEILEFLARNVKGFKSYIREHGSSFLSNLLVKSRCHFRSADDIQHWQEDCEVMVTVKWCMDLGAPLKGPVLANLVRHANYSFMLATIRNAADVDAGNDCDALQQAIRLGRLNLAVTLIESGAQVNGPHIWIASGELLGNVTTLQLACGRGAPLWFIRFLVDKGADVNAPPASNSGFTALQVACGIGAQLSCIQFLIEKGADVNAPPSPKNGFTALQCAADRGLMNIAGLLLDHRADVNAISGFSQFSPCGFVRAIDLAARNSRLDMVHFLIAAGARSFQPGRTGFDSAIKIATQQRNFAIARLLQEHADSRSGDPLEAEYQWLQENSHACLYNGRIQDAGWVAFVKRTGRDSDKDFSQYMEELSD